MITYSDGSASDAYSLAVTYDSAFYAGGSVANWGASTAHSDRLYAVKAIVTANAAPFLSDLSVPREFFLSNLNIGDSILVAHVYEVDTHDLEYLTFTRLDAHGVYFDMNVVQNASNTYAEFLVLNIPPVGNYTIQFEVQDTCLNTASGTAQIIVKYRPLAIMSLPNVVTIHIQNPGPLSLHTLVVQSDVMFGCIVNTVSPSVPTGAIIINSGIVTVVDVSILSAPVTYSIIISCTDSEGTEDMKTLTVNSAANTVPRVDGFIDSAIVDASTTSVNDVILSNAVVDDQGDAVTILSYCDQSPCPFQLLNSGEVICTDDLNLSNDTTFTIHFGLTDGYLISTEYILNIYIQNINVPPYISNLVPGNKNIITVSETTTVGSLVFNVNGNDDNPSDVLVYSFLFDSPDGASYFAYSTNDGSLNLISPLNYTSLQLLSLTVFGVNITVSDGKASSDVYMLEIEIMPKGISKSTGNSDTTSGSSGTSGSPQSDLSLTNIVLAGVLGIFVMVSLALCVILMMKKTRTHTEDLNSSEADLISIHSKFRVVQVEPSHGNDPIVKLSKPRMTSVD
ncbi:uncharacterized protein LOC123555265 [Mercenaria mercenaria]|uniref:uncharacterized protein LOC123555265 n=1 Tax=Mercenaria mercenaria TaxID=6596 RepID=UPI00234FB1CD|nr:uncharacterized protein LOC123555265 [Mercenaria mercenaria]